MGHSVLTKCKRIQISTLCALLYALCQFPVIVVVIYTKTLDLALFTSPANFCAGLSNLLKKIIAAIT